MELRQAPKVARLLQVIIASRVHGHLTRNMAFLAGAALGTVTAGVAHRLRNPAAAHLDRIEQAWTHTGALVQDGESSS